MSIALPGFLSDAFGILKITRRYACKTITCEGSIFSDGVGSKFPDHACVIGVCQKIGL
jgi:hypothetical protein